MLVKLAFYYLGGQIGATVRASPGIRYCEIDISRRIDPVADLVSLIRLFCQLGDVAPIDMVFIVANWAIYLALGGWVFSVKPRPALADST